MGQREKDQARENHERFMKKHFRTRAEEKQIQEAARARRAARGAGGKGRRRRYVEEDEDGAVESFEKIARAPRVKPAPRAEPAPLGSGSSMAPPRSARAATPLGSPSSPAGGGSPTPGSLPALVVAVHRDRVRVRGEDGSERDARPVRELLAETPRPAVGDRVLLVEQADGGARIGSIEPRRTVLSRPDPSDPRRERVLAANVDHALIVASARQPDLRPALVERVLLALFRGGVTPLVCVNKVDLIDGAERAALEAHLVPWRARGIACHRVSADSGEGIGELEQAIGGSTCVLVGHSGVGKSSLLNALGPSNARATSAVRRGDGKGRHTTTSSQLIDLGGGTRVIDTPGIRAFGLWNVRREDLDAAFPDVAARALSCRFGDCRHGPEPDCGLRAGVAAGELAAERVEAYLRLAAELRA